MLKPLENYLLLTNGKIKRDKLFELIFFDLILTGVLTITKENNKKKTSFIIKKGTNYKDYTPRKFENPFIDMLDKGLVCQLTQYIRIVNELIGTPRSVISMMLKSSEFSNYAKSSFFSSFKLKKKGLAELKKLNTLLSSKQKGTLLNNLDLLESINLLGSNILLIEGVKLSDIVEEIKKIDSKTLQTFTTNIPDIHFPLIILSDNHELLSNMSHDFDATSFGDINTSIDGIVSDSTDSHSGDSNCSNCGASCGASCGSGCSN